MPSQPYDAGVLLAHGAGAGQNHPFMERLRRGLPDAGYPTLTFDYAYMNAGRRAPDRMDKLLAVHQAAADRLATYVGRVFVAGKSMGGRVGSHLVGDNSWPAAGLIYYGYPLVPLGKTEARPVDHLRRIVAPQLFFAGSRDRLSPLQTLRPVVDSLSAATLHVIEDGDHSFKVPKRTGRTYDEVLDELVAATASWLAQAG
jgi:predicted alpha/beta-hydrolase family hydrolase